MVNEITIDNECKIQLYELIFEYIQYAVYSNQSNMIKNIEKLTMTDSDCLQDIAEINKMFDSIRKKKILIHMPSISVPFSRLSLTLFLLM